MLTSSPVPRQAPLSATLLSRRTAELWLALCSLSFPLAYPVTCQIVGRNQVQVMNSAVSALHKTLAPRPLSRTVSRLPGTRLQWYLECIERNVPTSKGAACTAREEARQ